MNFTVKYQKHAKKLNYWITIGFNFFKDIVHLMYFSSYETDLLFH